MIRSGCSEIYDPHYSTVEDTAKATYTAMLAAAPSPPKDPRDEAIKVARAALEAFMELAPDWEDKLDEAIHQIKEIMGEK